MAGLVQTWDSSNMGCCMIGCTTTCVVWLIVEYPSVLVVARYFYTRCRDVRMRRHSALRCLRTAPLHYPYVTWAAMYT